MAKGHLDELQKADKYPIRWSLKTGFTVLACHQSVSHSPMCCDQRMAQIEI